MAQDRKKTAWMWLSGDQLLGLSIDLERQRMTWVWQAGCHCADEDEIVQSIGAFRRQGTPPLIGPLPEDVAAEVEEVLPTA